MANQAVTVRPRPTAQMLTIFRSQDNDTKYRALGAIARAGVYNYGLYYNELCPELQLRWYGDVFQKWSEAKASGLPDVAVGYLTEMMSIEPYFNNAYRYRVERELDVQVLQHMALHGIWHHTLAVLPFDMDPDLKETCLKTHRNFNDEGRFRLVDEFPSQQMNVATAAKETDKLDEPGVVDKAELTVGKKAELTVEKEVKLTKGQKKKQKRQRKKEIQNESKEMTAASTVAESEIEELPVVLGDAPEELPVVLGDAPEELPVLLGDTMRIIFCEGTHVVGELSEIDEASGIVLNNAREEGNGMEAKELGTVFCMAQQIDFIGHDGQ